MNKNHYYHLRILLATYLHHPPRSSGCFPNLNLLPGLQNRDPDQMPLRIFRFFSDWSGQLIGALASLPANFFPIVHRIYAKENVT